MPKCDSPSDRSQHHCAKFHQNRWSRFRDLARRKKKKERRKSKIHFASGPRFLDPKAPSLKEMGKVYNGERRQRSSTNVLVLQRRLGGSPCRAHPVRFLAEPCRRHSSRIKKGVHATAETVLMSPLPTLSIVSVCTHARNAVRPSEISSTSTPIACHAEIAQ